jgi:hypothetical protein
MTPPPTGTSAVGVRTAPVPLAVVVGVDGSGAEGAGVDASLPVDELQAAMIPPTATKPPT